MAKIIRQAPTVGVFVVIGEHFEVPGTRVTVHATKEGADKAALDLVNMMLRDTDAGQEPETKWEDGLAWLQDYHCDAGCDVVIFPCKLEG